MGDCRSIVVMGKVTHTHTHHTHTHNTHTLIHTLLFSLLQSLLYLVFCASLHQLVVELKKRKCCRAEEGEPPPLPHSSEGDQPLLALTDTNEGI